MWKERNRNRMVAVNGLVVGFILSVCGLANAAGFSFKAIDYHDSDYSAYTAANANSTHEIVGEYGYPDLTHGFVLDKGVFTPIDVPGAVSTTVKGITENGMITGTYWTGEYLSDGNGSKRTYAYFLRKGSFTTIDPPDSIQSQAGFVNARGQVVGTYRTSDQKRHGFIWYKGAYTTFNVPDDDPLLGTEALGINDWGQIVGDYVDAWTGKRHGFLLSEGTYTTLDVPTAIWTIATGMNNSGQIVGVYYKEDVGTGHHGFVFSDGVYTTTDFPNQEGTRINSINEQGAIVGSFTDPRSDYDRGFVGTPIR